MIRFAIASQHALSFHGDGCLIVAKDCQASFDLSRKRTRCSSGRPLREWGNARPGPLPVRPSLERLRCWPILASNLSRQPSQRKTGKTFFFTDASRSDMCSANEQTPRLPSPRGLEVAVSDRLSGVSCSRNGCRLATVARTRSKWRCA